MRNKNLFIRVPAFLFGLLCMGFGIGLITKAGLGTSPISSLAYVLSLIFPFSFGQFTLAFSVLFLLLQLPILKKDFKKRDWLQIIVAVIFGIFVDLGMRACSGLNPVFYPWRLSLLAVGCLVMAIGVYLQVRADIIMNPGEGLVKAIASKGKFEFGAVKIAFDATLVVLAILLSLFIFHAVRGVREGTLVAAVLTGYLTRCLGKAEATIRRLFPVKKTRREIRP
jgi:uncharacterized membrane protein YczE